jgi:hypothetical protein
MTENFNIPNEGAAAESSAEANTNWQVQEDPNDAMYGEYSTEAEPVSPSPTDEPSWEQQWEATGDPVHLPPQLQGVHKDMIAGMNMKFRELAAEKLALQQATSGVVQESGQAVGGNEMPALDDSTDEKWKDSVQARIDWQVQQQMSGVNTKLETQQQTLNMAAAKEEQTRIRSHPNHSPEVEGEMARLASTDAFWASSLQTKTGVDTLQAQAITNMTQAQRSASQQQRIQNAPHQAVMRGGGGNATPSDKYASSFDQIAEEVFADAGVPYK